MSVERTRRDHSSSAPSWAGGPRPAGPWRVVVPVLNEATALPALLAESAALPGLLERIVFVDNGSSDGSGDLIRAAGGTVVHEQELGYGFACLAGVVAASADLSRGRGSERAEQSRRRGEREDGPARGAVVPAVAFMEGDGSDDPAALPRLLGPVLSGDVDLMIGSRRRAVAAGAGMAAHQRWGNLATVLMLRLLFGIRVPDNGPFRAVRLDLLESLGMEPRGFAWTTEMVIKAHLAGAKIAWVEMPYRSRAGRSKISGTVKGTARAFRGIFGTMLRLRLRAVPSRGPRRAGAQ